MYNSIIMEPGNTPEFYTGAPVEPADLRFRGAFLEELWQTLRTGHVVLTAPRRTGKTSVMDYLRDHPESGFSVVSINVQDLSHPADFFQVLLDRLWRREQRTIVATDVDTVFDAIIVGSAARTRLQHFHSRIGQYYADTQRSIAHALLGQVSVSTSGRRRVTLLQETERTLADLGVTLAAHDRRQLFNRLLLDLENDFYVVEVEEEVYDFASGVLKAWWRKYHA